MPDASGIGICGAAVCWALETPAVSGTAAIAARNAALRISLADGAAGVRMGLRLNLRMNFSFPAGIPVNLSEWGQLVRSTQYRKK